MKFVVKDFMVENVICVTPEMKLREVAELFIQHDISGAPIVDRQKKLLSVIGEGITLRLTASEGLEATVAHCLPKMTPAAQVLTLKKTDAFTEVYRLFLKHNIHRIPIVDDAGTLEGLVSRTTILRIFIEAHYGRKIAAKPK